MFVQHSSQTYSWPRKWDTTGRQYTLPSDVLFKLFKYTKDFQNSVKNIPLSRIRQNRDHLHEHDEVFTFWNRILEFVTHL